MTCHYIDKELMLKSIVLANRFLTSDHTADYLNSVILEVLAEFNIKDKVKLNLFKLTVYYVNSSYQIKNYNYSLLFIHK